MDDRHDQTTHYNHSKRSLSKLGDCDICADQKISFIYTEFSKIFQIFFWFLNETQQNLMKSNKFYDIR
jgi:hypothetical protein